MGGLATEIKEKEKDDYSIFGNARRVPKVRGLEELVKVDLPEDEEVAEEKQETTTKKEKSTNKKGQEEDGGFDYMVDSDALLKKLNKDKDLLDAGIDPDDEIDPEDNDEIYDGDEEEQEEFKEFNFFDLLLENPKATWGTWRDWRKAGHTLAYNRIIEKPLNLPIIEDIKVELKAKVRAKVASPEEEDLYFQLDDYLEKVNKLGKEYLSGIEYGELHNQMGERWLENKIRKLNIKGKKMNSDMMFGFFMLGKEAQCMAKLYEISKSIPKVNI